jgi:hypothetical protein
MKEDKPKKGRPRKKAIKPSLTDKPMVFMPDAEYNLTEMQTAFVWHYSRKDSSMQVFQH